MCHNEQIMTGLNKSDQHHFFGQWNRKTGLIITASEKAFLFSLPSSFNSTSSFFTFRPLIGYHREYTTTISQPQGEKFNELKMEKEK